MDVREPDEMLLILFNFNHEKNADAQRPTIRITAFSTVTSTAHMRIQRINFFFKYMSLTRMKLVPFNFRATRRPRGFLSPTNCLAITNAVETHKWILVVHDENFVWQWYIRFELIDTSYTNSLDIRNIIFHSTKLLNYVITPR